MSKTCPDRECPLYVAIRKYGIENFTFEVIEECRQEELNEKEIYWIKYYNSYGSGGYNATLGGDTGHLYDYSEIYNLWKQGYLCKEIEQIVGCTDAVITNALRSYGLSEQEVRSRATKSKKYVAIDVKTREPLKVFTGQNSISLFLTGKDQSGALYNAIKLKQRLFGYYWEELTENNIPERELSDEEFLSHKAKPMHTYSEEEKEKMSLKSRTVERPSREELKKLIREKPFLQIGKMFNVSDNAIRKWCDRMDLPRKKTDINAYSDEEWALI